MGFVSMSVLFKAFVALQLLVSVYGLVDDDSQAEWFKKPPVAAPVGAPKPSPPHHHSPSPPPHRSPFHFLNRKPIAVQGVVYCKSCKYSGSHTLNGVSPLSGAGVKLKCNNRKHQIIQDATTNKKGYFFIQPQKNISSFGVHKCRVVLASSPLASCKNATNLNGGLLGAILKFEKPKKPTPFALYHVGPFAFGPTKC